MSSSPRPTASPTPPPTPPAFPPASPADLPAHVRSEADLTRAWSCLMGELGFSGASIWVLLLAADARPHPHLMQIEKADVPPDTGQAARFAQMLGSVLAQACPGGRAAVLRSRPGSGGPTVDDLAWARALLGACRTAGVPMTSVHHATDVALRPVTGDDLLGGDPGLGAAC